MPDDRALVTDVVLVEAVCTLKSAFQQGKKAQLTAVRSLLEETAFAFEDREAVAAALSMFEAGSCGFAACLVVAKQARQGCDFTASLDHDMRELPRVRLL
jgi:predicted nucleic-acid-binding protein